MAKDDSELRRCSAAVTLPCYPTTRNAGPHEAFATARIFISLLIKGNHFTHAAEEVGTAGDRSLLSYLSKCCPKKRQRSARSWSVPIPSWPELSVARKAWEILYTTSFRTCTGNAVSPYTRPSINLYITRYITLCLIPFRRHKVGLGSHVRGHRRRGRWGTFALLEAFRKQDIRNWICRFSHPNSSWPGCCACSYHASTHSLRVSVQLLIFHST
ncbi:hypothetical protein SCLCIDRAFT_964025 [Scleroderma citrinum Foug A]|uniref:Uncharacterized protein n=1 Tax=Scleroderma citrinum Foug A TaxID=1036808 RepID=A0A0C2ZET3_9AGAM|nr:hypothetical protein SCLCIDRAFT_964025 [Scleroderma citrinum Foug A]